MKKFLPILLIILLIAANDTGVFLLYQKQTKIQVQNYNDKITALQKQISDLQNQLAVVSSESAAYALSAKEMANRQIIQQKSQSQLVTDAVTKAVPAVVSVIISENVPQYQIQYKNPFGNDPFFQDFNIKIPVYVPTGQTKLQQVGAGTGFLISSDGYILTNKHVVDNTKADYTVLLSDGEQESAKVIYKDPQNDIAVIKINGNNYPTVQFDDSNGLQLGQTVIAIGNALGQYNNSVSVGVISGLNRTINASGGNGVVETLNGVIQTDAAINPGNSGGPLLDLDGNAVGINVAIVSGANNIGFSIPINTVEDIIQSVI
jgi:serine protease Do